jgi:hypothetical protein
MLGHLSSQRLATSRYVSLLLMADSARPCEIDANTPYTSRVLSIEAHYAIGRSGSKQEMIRSHHRASRRRPRTPCIHNARFGRHSSSFFLLRHHFPRRPRCQF